jgi:purine-binding chemotaxis protein CheW
MNSILRFTTAVGDFALPVAHVRSVRTADELRGLPDAREGVAGALFGDGPAVPVVDALGTGGSLVVVVEVGDGVVGVLADDVTGVISVEDDDLGPAPAGQRSGLVCGLVSAGSRKSMLIDPRALLARVSQ